MGMVHNKTLVIIILDSTSESERDTIRKILGAYGCMDYRTIEILNGEVVWVDTDDTLSYCSLSYLSHPQCWTAVDGEVDITTSNKFIKDFGAVLEYNIKVKGKLVTLNRKELEDLEEQISKTLNP